MIQLPFEMLLLDLCIVLANAGDNAVCRDGCLSLFICGDCIIIHSAFMLCHDAVELATLLILTHLVVKKVHQLLLLQRLLFLLLLFSSLLLLDPPFDLSCKLNVRNSFRHFDLSLVLDLLRKTLIYVFVLAPHFFALNRLLLLDALVSFFDGFEVLLLVGLGQFF